MKATTPLLCGLAIALVSCASLDPEYAEYKEQKKAQESAPSPYGSNPDPYGSAASNPYGVPSSGSAGSEVGSYTPSRSPNAPPPYQPLPGVPSDPLPPTRVNPGTNYPSYPSIPSTGGSGAVSAGASSHTVAKGDSLWGLSRRYGTSVSAIKQANGLTSDTIRIGQTLQIPKN